MQVILLERVDKLGQMGDVVAVKPGYARNYLLPQQKALRATKENIAYFESRRGELEAQNKERRSEAEGIAGKMEGVKLIIVRQAGESGQLYGSVTARDIADELKEEGFKIERGLVDMPMPIKQLGQYQVLVKLHPEVSIHVTATVARSKDEADIAAADAANLLERPEDAEEAEVQEEEAERVLHGDDEPESEDSTAA